MSLCTRGEAATVIITLRLGLKLVLVLALAAEREFERIYGIVLQRRCVRLQLLARAHLRVLVRVVLRAQVGIRDCADS